MEIDSRHFKEVRGRSEEFYKNLSQVYCPYFKEKVSFNIQGLKHLKFKHQGKVRPQQDQFMRFKLLHLAPIVLQTSSTLQGIWETKGFEDTRIRNRTDNILSIVTYYEFIAVIDKVRVKIIVKQIENGQRFFWSIIPYWGINKNTKTRKLYNGSPEQD